LGFEGVGTMMGITMMVACMWLFFVVLSLLQLLHFQLFDTLLIEIKSMMLLKMCVLAIFLMVFKWFKMERNEEK
jgi:hypothetical protein